MELEATWRPSSRDLQRVYDTWAAQASDGFRVLRMGESRRQTDELARFGQMSLVAAKDDIMLVNWVDPQNSRRGRVARVDEDTLEVIPIMHARDHPADFGGSSVVLPAAGVNGGINSFWGE